MLILIAGAGYIGMPLAIQFAISGHDVVVIKKQACASPHPNIRIINTDITTLSEHMLPKRIDRAFYLIAAETYTAEAYKKAYIDGLTRFCDASKHRLVGPAIFSSSTSVYAQQDSSYVNENSPTTPDHFAGTIMLEAEQRFLQYGNQYSCARLSGIYGPQRCRILDAVQAQLPPPHNHYTNRIHQVDAVNALIHLSQLPQLASHYIVSDNLPTRYTTIYTYIQALLGLSTQDIPNQVSPPSSSRGGNKCLDNHRLRNTGFTFVYPTYKEGMRAIIQPTTPPYLQPQ